MPNKYANICLYIIQCGFTKRASKLDYASGTNPYVTCGVTTSCIERKRLTIKCRHPVVELRTVTKALP